MGDDWLQGLTRQTQELDFSELVSRSYGTRSDRLDEERTDEDSVAGDVEKLSVLDMIDALEDADEPQRLVDLQRQLKMPMVEVWIAALLGGFPLEQLGSFYQTQEVWVGRCR